jgi:hypothetical protein
MRRLVARVYVRLGRKKQERTKQRRGAAEGLALLFVAIHGAKSSTESADWQPAVSFI